MPFRVPSRSVASRWTGAHYLTNFGNGLRAAATPTYWGNLSQVHTQYPTYGQSRHSRSTQMTAGPAAVPPQSLLSGPTKPTTPVALARPTQRRDSIIHP